MTEFKSGAADQTGQQAHHQNCLFTLILTP